MSISTAVHPERICLIKSQTKKEALLELIHCLDQRGDVKDISTLTEKIFYREQLMSTGIGLGIAVPHVRMEGIREPLAVIGVSLEGIHDYPSIDNKTVRIVVMIVAGKEQHQKYIKLLAQVVTRLKTPGLIDRLQTAGDSEKIYQIFMEPDHVID